MNTTDRFVRVAAEGEVITKFAPSGKFKLGSSLRQTESEHHFLSRRVAFGLPFFGRHEPDGIEPAVCFAVIRAAA
jgi:hypothetical protein